MKYDANIKPVLGTFVLLHAKTKTAYVGECKNLRQRQYIWRGHFKRAETDPNYRMPVRDLWSAGNNSTDYQFLGYEKPSLEVRNALWQKGVTVINKTATKRSAYTVDGVPGSLRALAALHKISYPMAYKRIQKGYTIRQALGLDPIDDVADVRDRSVALMPVKIVGTTGGYLSYDEAQVERPELGNIRAKLAKLRKAHPEMTEVGLGEIS